jgi:hypothetical protein
MTMPDVLTRAAARILPPPGVARALAAQSIVYAAGTGFYFSGNAVFFTQVIGLRADQIGLGFSIAGLVSLVLAVPAGALADRLGPKRTWFGAVLIQACLFVLYPIAAGLPSFDRAAGSGQPRLGHAARCGARPAAYRLDYRLVVRRDGAGAHGARMVGRHRAGDCGNLSHRGGALLAHHHDAPARDTTPGGMSGCRPACPTGARGPAPKPADDADSGTLNRPEPAFTT